METFDVFIAYKGSTYGKRIALSVDQCVSSRKWMNSHVALAGAIGEITFADEQDILEDIDHCDIFVAINTMGHASVKFLDECSWARYDLKKPVVAVVQEGSRPPPSLRIRSRIYQVRFDRWSSVVCAKLVHAIKATIERSPPANRTRVGRALPRRSLHA